MRRYILIWLLSLLVCWPAGAQLPKQRDTVVFKPTQLIAPGVLIGSGVVIHLFAHDAIDVPVRDFSRGLYHTQAQQVGEDVFQYMAAFPLIMDLGLGIPGIRSKHGLTDRFVEAGIASALVGGTSLLLKNVIYSPRPDGSNNNSFPSGHSALAFMGAELVRMEYGWLWGLGAYTFATAAALMRCYYDRHWLSDLLLGAGLGILGAHAGEWLLEPVKKLFDLDTSIPGVRAAVAPTVDPFSGSVCATLAFRF